MIWFYYFLIIIIVLLCPNYATFVANSSSSSSSIGNQLVRDGNGGMNKSCFHNEKQALLHFRAFLDRDPFGSLSTWTSEEDDDCCNWSGIICSNQTGHVTELQLGSYVIGGEISPSLLNLTYLNYLDLSWNTFNGIIPNFIGSMTQLRYLDLSSNTFEGIIPNFIGSITQLRYLDLHFNNFQGTIPRSIGSLTQLRYLDLSWNYFNGTIPPEFGNLTNLRNLTLGSVEKSCTIENLDWLSNLSHLQNLQVTYISLAKTNYWVDVILSLQNLSDLTLWGCDLSEIMHPFSSFLSSSSSSSSIKYLRLRENNLNSSMYRWLFSLISSKLVSLDLSGNMLDGIPKYLGNLCSLTYFDFSSNSAVVNFTDFLNNMSGCTSVTLQDLQAVGSQFTGSLTEEIQKFSSLQSLDLSKSTLNGTMSEKVWELANLTYLDVSSNSLVISPNIGKSKLQHIDLSNNSLVMTPSKADMLNLYYIVEDIDMSACNLGPFFPKWIQTHKNLTHLDISNNKIADIIPVNFWKTWPSRLTYLNLSSNNISGEVPDLSSNFGLYSTIDLSSNGFYGPISVVTPTLVSLNLSKNKFYGGISFLCQIVDGLLSYLDLSNNSFTGPFPDCLWHFKELRVINLEHNNLSGRLPASIGYLVQLEVLHLYNNNFSGELPMALKNCTNLEFLNLGANKFFGNVPIWVGESLPWLYGLSLRSNNFFGPIPIQLCHLVKLQILDLSINNLIGTIPSCLNNMSAIVQGRFKWRPNNNMHDYGMSTNNDRQYSIIGSYADNAIIGWQGKEQEFTNNLGLLTSIDLSSNNLTGQIPNELADLHGLHVLNLSKNALFGVIPQRIGEMKELLTLDLSRNNFSGVIPSSMSGMSLLNYLDVSYNSLSGRIPSSTQLQSFEPSRYTGNAGLCGPPLTKNCPGDKVLPVASKSESVEEGTDEVERWFYIGGSIGFATGFWIACGVLLVNRCGRHAFFPFVDFLKDWVYVKVVVFIRKLQSVQYP